MLLPYAIVECPQQQIIVDKTLAFLDQATDLLRAKNLHLWNKIDTKQLIKAVPEIPEYYHTLGLKLKEVAFTVWNKHEDASLHIDELPVIAKINFPILNTANTYNEWYSVPDYLMKQVSPLLNQFGSEFYDLASIDLDLCEKIGEVELVKPIVFNSQIPHKIRIEKNALFPRVVMTCMFFNQPVKWIESIDSAH